MFSTRLCFISRCLSHFLNCLRSPYCLYDNTDVEETDEVYVTEHALSLGRSELLFLFICVSLKVVLAILRHMFEIVI
jgi:hypothetical protein